MDAIGNSCYITLTNLLSVLTMLLLFFQPTFTHGLIIGQLSILILLGMILKYLFLESSQYPIETTSYHQQVDNDAFLRERELKVPNTTQAQDSNDFESTKWFNTLLSQVRILPQFLAVSILFESGRRYISIQITK